MQAESEVRRRVAESIHDGPVQELIGLDMILSAARGEADEERVAGLIDEARDLVSRNEALEQIDDEVHGLSLRIGLLTGWLVVHDSVRLSLRPFFRFHWRCCMKGFGSIVDFSIVG